MHNGSYTDHLTFPMPEPVEDVIVINGSSLFIAQIGVSGLRLLSRQRFLLLALSVKHADFFFYSFPQEIGNIICDIHLVPRLFPWDVMVPLISLNYLQLGDEIFGVCIKLGEPDTEVLK